jgi:hypothetical protein
MAKLTESKRMEIWDIVGRISQGTLDYDEGKDLVKGILNITISNNK